MKKKGHEETTIIATAVEACCDLVVAGFEYVCDVDGVKIFRKKK